MIETLFCLLLVVWFGCSVVGQTQLAWSHRLRACDKLGVIPDWRVFTHPDISEYGFLFRDRNSEGQVLGWREFLTVDCRRWFHPLWNTEKYLRKAVSNLVTALSVDKNRLASSTEKSPEYLAAGTFLPTGPYFVVLHAASKMRRKPAAATQFAILKKGSGEEPAVFLVSRFHRL